MGRYQGMELDILGPDEIKRPLPLRRDPRSQGALYDPYDGDIDPAQLTQAWPRAPAMGARIERFCPMTGAGARATNGHRRRPRARSAARRSSTPPATTPARSARHVRPRRADDGDEPPVHPVRHHPRARGLVAEVGQNCRCCATSTAPTTSARRSSASTSAPMSATAARIGPRPTTRCPTISPSSSSPTISTGSNGTSRRHGPRADARQGAGLQKVINGPIPYTPDGNPLIGPMPGVPNAFEACVFTFGICQAAGPARCWPNG
jgi:dimethylglycine dehydrogenase